jgi:hypothetical protein
MLEMVEMAEMAKAVLRVLRVLMVPTGATVLMDSTDEMARTERMGEMP